jgi:hypothetical protein
MNRRVVALALLGLVGCAATKTAVQPSQLERLDGYAGAPAGGAKQEIETLAGGKLTMGPDAYLFLDVQGARVGGRFESIQVRDGVLEGRKVDGGQVKVPLDQVTSARIDEPDPRAPWAVAGGVLVAALASVIFIYAAHPGSVASTPSAAAAK